MRLLRDRESLIQSIPAGIILIQQRKIADMNEGMLNLLGYDAHEVMGCDFKDFVHPRQKRFEEDLFRKGLSRREVQEQYEIDLVAKDGGTISCAANIKRFRFKGKTAYLLNLTRLEQRRERERENHLSKKMEALTGMGAGLSREFGQYLKIVSRNIQDLITMADSDNSHLMESLKAIERALYGSLLSIHKLDSISKIEDDGRDKRPFDLKGVVKEAVTLTSPKWMDGPKGRGIQITLKTYLRSVSPVDGDPDEMKEAIINMILNAVEAMPEGGDIHLTTEENAGYAHIHIQDSGEGISEQIMDRIFDPFFTTRGDGAVGLGLSLVYAIIKRHGGEIEVTSQEDQGTIFSIRLPLAAKESIPRPRADRGRIKNARILIIQNDDTIRELLSYLLKEKGCRVETATNGPEGLGLLKKRKFDLVIADTGALNTDEERFVKSSKRIRRDLTIVLILENNKDAIPYDIDESAADLTMNKPLDLNKVVKKVSKLLV